MAIVIKRAAERVGLDPAAYSVTACGRASAQPRSERAIARQTGHAPGSTVLRTYIRHASVFTDNAVSSLGL